LFEQARVVLVDDTEAMRDRSDRAPRKRSQHGPLAAALVFLASWSVLSVSCIPRTAGSARPGRPPIRLQDLTVPTQSLPPGCGLKTSPPGGLNLVGTNPWIGTERETVAKIGSLIEGTPILPDAAPLGAREARRYFLRFADGVEEAYAAAYAQSGVRDVRVFALKFTAPEDARRVPFGPTTRPSTTSRIVLGSIVVVVDGPEHPCFEAVRDYVQSLVKRS
jgi:hypothetical protein